MDKKLLGRRINAARKERGMTGERLAEACNINATYLRQIEGGVKTPSLPMFITLCRVLKVSPNYLLPELVSGTEVEKSEEIMRILSESGPSPGQMEIIEEMICVILGPV